MARKIPSRFLLVAIILFVVVIAAVLMIPRNIAPDTQKADDAAKSQEWSQSARARNAAPAKDVMLQIVKAASAFHEQTNTWPASTEQLEKAGLVVIPDSVKRWWNFGITGQPPTSVTAYSTPAMPDGELRPITYLIAKNQFLGYGSNPHP